MTHLSEELPEFASDATTRADVGTILLLGPPGVGKGTQANELSKRWSIPHISTGELLRINVANCTVLGLSVKEIMNRGELVPDTLIKETVAARLLESDTARGYILDGFPRTLDQAIWLTEWIPRTTTARERPQILTVQIHVSKEELIRRIIGRRHCPLCRATFNIYNNRPKRDGFCDQDDTELVQRLDDTEETLNRRLDLYERLTSPVVEHLRTHGKFVEVSGDGPIQWISARILGAHYLAMS
jgi:adenylate kinase